MAFSVKRAATVTRCCPRSLQQLGRPWSVVVASGEAAQRPQVIPCPAAPAFALLVAWLTCVAHLLAFA
jgi:hypothetical protein